MTTSIGKLAGDGEIEVLLIILGNRCLGVPLQDVRYVAPMPVDFVSHGSEADEYFVFENNPLAFISLWNELNIKSAYVEYEELQLMLPQRRQDHLDWMAAFETTIRTGAAFTKARSPRECAFGKWFYNYQPRDMRLGLLLGKFEQPHAIIHGLADRLLALIDAGQESEAIRQLDEAKSTTLASLLRLFDSARELVVELQRRIAIIVEHDADTCALGADAVRNVVTIPAHRVKPAGNASSNATSALILLDDQSVVPLLNWQIFNTGHA